MRIVAVVALIAGFSSGLILDGQAYDHTLFGLACGVVAIACALAAGRIQWLAMESAKGSWITGGFGLALAVLCLVGLPSAKQSQDKFNERLERLEKPKEK